MKRIGNVMPEVIAYDNVSDSYDYIIGKVEHKNRLGSIRDKERFVEKLIKDLSTGNYHIGSYKEDEIREGPKTRIIQLFSIKDRIALNAIMKVVDKYLNRKFIKHTAASIKGKGTHYLHNELKEMLRKDPEGARVALKIDVKKCYASIDQEKMMYVIRRTFKDKALIDILDEYVHVLPEGLSIGGRPSQALANLYLSYYVDHVIKEKYRVKYYLRYCDDILILGDSFKTISGYADILFKLIKDSGLTIHPNYQMFDIRTRPIDFLGFKTYANGKIEIRKRIKKRFFKRFNRVISVKRKRELVASFYGICKHANSNNLFKNTFGINMKTFAELGLNNVVGGKQFFDVPVISIADLNNLTVVILDFQDDIKTRQGEGRFVVLIEMPDGSRRKFFTNNSMIKQNLLDARSQGELPFKTCIKRATGSNSNLYIFT